MKKEKRNKDINGAVQKNKDCSDNRDCLIIEENTIYEIDLDCYKCLKKENFFQK